MLENNTTLKKMQNILSVNTIKHDDRQGALGTNGLKSVLRALVIRTWETIYKIWNSVMFLSSAE